MFKLRIGRQHLHTVLPYIVSAGHEIPFHYLLCGEIDRNTGKQIARSYRLSRIDGIRSGSTAMQIEDKVKHYLEQTRQIAPQFAINSETVSRVRLSRDGIYLFHNVIYRDRPPLINIEEDGDGAIYSFDCSEDQLYFYFRRFEGGSGRKALEQE